MRAIAALHPLHNQLPPIPSTSRHSVQHPSLPRSQPINPARSRTEPPDAAPHILLRLWLPPPHPRPRVLLLPQRATQHQQPCCLFRPASQLLALQHGALLSASKLSPPQLSPQLSRPSSNAWIAQFIRSKRLQLLLPPRSQVPEPLRLPGSRLEETEGGV